MTVLPLIAGQDEGIPITNRFENLDIVHLQCADRDGNAVDSCYLDWEDGVAGAPAGEGQVTVVTSKVPQSRWKLERTGFIQYRFHACEDGRFLDGRTPFVFKDAQLTEKSGLVGSTA